MTGDYRPPAMNRGPFCVFMARLDALNKPCFYAFPTREAAERFAAAHRVGDRKVLVKEMTA